MVVIAQNNQSLLDLAIQTAGTPEAFLKLALVNDLNPTDAVVPGLNLSTDGVEVLNAAIVKYYNSHGLIAATALGEILPVIQLSCEQKLYECFKN